MKLSKPNYQLTALAPAVLLLAACTTPAPTVDAAAGLHYLGSDTFLIKGTHEAKRHHWARHDGRVVSSMITIQHERILDGVEGKYEFNIPPPKYLGGSNYRFDPAPAQLWGHEWVHNTWAFDADKSAAENPGREADRTAQLLAEHGLVMAGQRIMSRYVRAVGADQRAEVIVFYTETLADNGHTIKDFPDGGPASDIYDKLSAATIKRGRAELALIDSQYADPSGQFE